MAPNTPEFDGLGVAPGTGEGAAAGVGGLIIDGSEARMPPWSGHCCVGAVPIRNGTCTCCGHDGVAIPPDAGSMVAISIPDGSAKSCGSSGAVATMKSDHAG